MASTDSNLQDVPYGDGRAALIAHATSADDAMAVAHLPSGPNLEFLGMIPQGYRVFNRGDRYINHYLNMSKANVRVLGLPVDQDGAPDADIYIGQYYLAHNSFDYNRRDGVSGLDFVGVVSHEIGHALGFFSGVDDVDYYSLPNGPKAPDDLNEYSEVTTLDLFRYTTQSKPLFDLTPGGEPYFSLDGGQTSLGRFSSGVFNGDGWQASHWYAGTGLMGPYVEYDKLQTITALDRQAFDVIGWDLRAALAGDFNRDSHVDAADLQAMLGALTDLQSFQLAAGLSDSDLLTIGDLNGDGVITNADLQAMLTLLSSGTGSLTAVPESGTMVLLMAAAPGLWGIGRRLAKALPGTC